MKEKYWWIILIGLLITIIGIVTKKYLFLLQNQKHPAHCHKKKKETFLILFGEIELNIILNKKKKKKIMKPGEMFTIEPGTSHEFKALSLAGTVIEEISTESIRSDSYYLDDRISKNRNRKSFISFY